MLKRIVIGGLMVVFLIGFALNIASARVFARGGGKSRTIEAVDPAQVYNAER